MRKDYNNILTKKFLKKEYIENKKSSIIISLQIGCAKSTILDYLKKYNIPRRKNVRNKFSKKEKNCNWKGGKIKTNCVYCDKKFLVYPCVLKNKQNIFCSCSCRAKYRKGKLAANWQGGLSFEEYGVEFDNHLKEQIRFRDNYKCKICGCSQLENGRQLDVHHIDYNKKNNKLNNLVSLCNNCHMKTNGNRKYWENYFKVLLKNLQLTTIGT